MLRWSLLTVILAVLLAVCGAVFFLDGTWWNLVKAVGYALAALALAWGVVAAANHFGLTGKSFHLSGWLDAIADAQPDGTVGPNANRTGMAIVVASLVLGVLFLAGSFVHP
jgi:hypothetical protein